MQLVYYKHVIMYTLYIYYNCRVIFMVDKVEHPVFVHLFLQFQLQNHYNNKIE